MTEQERIARFWATVDKTGPCWLWQGQQAINGYGRVYWPGRGTQYAHRLAYELAFGPFLPGLDVCHRCDNPACVRPDHLWLGTAADNMADRDRKGRNGMVGKPSPTRRLTDAQVAEIRQRYGKRHYYQRGEVTLRQLSAEYGVAFSAIRRIVTGHSYTIADTAA